jgi:hypothetical protein
VLLDDHGLEIRYAVIGPARIAWADVESVWFNEPLGVLKIRSRGGRCRWLSRYLDGLGTLRVYLARHAPGAADTSARAIMPAGGAGRTVLTSRRYPLTALSHTAWKRK